MYKLVLSFRYLFRRRISYLAFLSVALCVFIVVVVMTVMRGLVTDFREKNHSFVGDCVVGMESLVGFPCYEDFIRISESEDFVLAVSPVVKSYGLVSFTVEGVEQSAGVEVMGIDAAGHSRVTGFGETLYEHKDKPQTAFQPLYDPNLPGFVVGVDMWLLRDAKGKYLYARQGPAARAVSCFPLTTKGALAKASTGVVNTKTFYYSDTSHSGLAHVDSSMLYLPLEDAQLLCGMAGAEKRVSLLCIKFSPDIKLENGCDKVAQLWQDFVGQRSDHSLAGLLADVNVQSWKDYRRPFIAAMEKEQTMLIIMFALVGVTTVFIVFVVFYMIVSHKSKDIGILKSIGISQLNLIGLFIDFAVLVAVLGSLVGVLGGWLFLQNINRIEGWLFEHFQFQLWDRTIYAIGDIPNRVDFTVLAVIVASAIAACLAGALIPSWQAARTRPVETLQVAQL